jgi:hypothetical protein
MSRTFSHSVQINIKTYFPFFWVRSGFSIRLKDANWNIISSAEIRDNSVGIATGYGLNGWGVAFRVLVGARFPSSPPLPDRFWGTPSFLTSGHRDGVFFPGVKRPGCEADHLPPIAPRSTIRGSIHPLSHTSSWRSPLLVKHTGNFTSAINFHRWVKHQQSSGWSGCSAPSLSVFLFVSVLFHNRKSHLDVIIFH